MKDLHELHHTTAAFSEFFEQNREQFLSFAYSYIRNRADAEDLLMESMIVLWQGRDKWEEPIKLHGLLLTILKNKALNHLAHEQVRLRAKENINMHEQRELELRLSSLQACDPEVIFSTEIRQIVNRAIEHLPEQSRRIFILSRYRNIPNKKIAEQLNISVKSVEFHITKALKKLRLELKDYLFYLLF
jgi:RNA polymerase sigma-70 factor (ECF subfamily)